MRVCFSSPIHNVLGNALDASRYNVETVMYNVLLHVVIVTACSANVEDNKPFKVN